jgi:(2R)-3-sulfolactate dehydrogenase (NADP+)
MARLTLNDIEAIAYRALIASRTSPANARCVAASIAAAEADGIPSHGLMRLPSYCAHAKSGKVDGHAQPSLARAAPAVLRVDARNGFAHPAIEAALAALLPLARDQGIAAASVFNSYNAGVMGHHVEWLALEGCVGLAFANAPAVMAPWGGRSPVFGTNPIAFAVPRDGEPPIVIDQASTVVARGEIMLSHERHDTIPEGWGYDASGKPTHDPAAVLGGGTLVPSGQHKGANLALIVEVLAATLTGALHSFEAGSLTHDDGKRAGLGQLFIAIDPERLAGPGFHSRLSALCDAILADPRVRLPGSRRVSARAAAKSEGVEVPEALHERVLRLAPDVK